MSRRGVAHGPRPQSFTVCAHAAPTGDIDVTSAELVNVWLRVLGPTSTVVWQHLARSLAVGTFDTSTADLAEWSGVGPAVVWNALDRLVGFGRAVWLNDSTLTVQVIAEPPRWVLRGKVAS